MNKCGEVDMSDNTESVSDDLEVIKEGYTRVSTIVGAFKDFSGIPKKIFENKRRIGTEVHGMIEQYFDGSTVDKNKCMFPRSLGYYQSFLKWKKDTEFNVIAAEKRYYDDTLKITGKVDLVADFNGEVGIVDFKTSAAVDHVGWGVQGYFYWYLLNYGYCADDGDVGCDGDNDDAGCDGDGGIDARDRVNIEERLRECKDSVKEVLREYKDNVKVALRECKDLDGDESVNKEGNHKSSKGLKQINFVQLNDNRVNYNTFKYGSDEYKEMAEEYLKIYREFS